jgi:hypothetical protein
LKKVEGKKIMKIKAPEGRKFGREKITRNIAL